MGRRNCTGHHSSFWSTVVRALSTSRTLLLTAIGALALTACGPRAHIPARPVFLPGALGPEDTGAVLARQLAPTLYLQRDETFHLQRAVAVLHPTRPVIAYFLLYNHDVAGRWYPFGNGADEEEVWVGYDSTHVPTDLWTYWHGDILHTRWHGQVLVDVQWGKHGSLPRGVIPETLPSDRSLRLFYALTWVLPDLWLGRLSSRGPLCFCHDFERYLEFTRPIQLAGRLTAIARTADPDQILGTVFGARYARKPFWPWEARRVRPRAGEVSGREALLEER